MRHVVLIAVFTVLSMQAAQAQEPIVILGRPTNRTITANVVMDRAGSFALAYGKRSEQYSDTTELRVTEAGVPVVLELSKLSETRCITTVCCIVLVPLEHG